MGKTGRRLAAAHGDLTPAHADGCAAQCFEGVQRGSSPLQKRGKGDTLLHGLLWVLGCFVYLEVKNLGNQLGSHPAYLFSIEAKASSYFSMK